MFREFSLRTYSLEDPGQAIHRRKFMKLSMMACQIISDSLALYFLEAGKLNLANKKTEILRTVSEFNDYIHSIREENKKEA
ncbi:MAG: hypothetical protein WCW25_04915 [Patescibacteria group bacterium]